MTDYNDLSGFTPISELEEMLEDHKLIRSIIAKWMKLYDMSFEQVLETMQNASTCELCDYDLVNMAKHGMDGARSETGAKLEIKNTSLTGKNARATFNDTTEDKIECFSEPGNELVVVEWGCGPVAMTRGKTSDIAPYLSEQLAKQIANNNKRKTQTLTASRLVQEFGFERTEIGK